MRISKMYNEGWYSIPDSGRAFCWRKACKMPYWWTLGVSDEWEHLTTWDCPYSMRCAKAESTHVWLSYQGKYCRCIRTRFTDLAYKNIIDGYLPLAGSFWGYPHMIEKDGDVTYHRMYVLEKAFKSKEETLLDIDNFKTQPDIAFRNVLNDIFGDG